MHKSECHDSLACKKKETIAIPLSILTPRDMEHQILYLSLHQTYIQMLQIPFVGVASTLASQA